jgi:hypothetical protein
MKRKPINTNDESPISGASHEPGLLFHSDAKGFIQVWATSSTPNSLNNVMSLNCLSTKLGESKIQ